MSPCFIIWNLIVIGILIANFIYLVLSGNPRNFNKFVYGIFIFISSTSSLSSSFCIISSVALCRTWGIIVERISALEEMAKDLFIENSFDVTAILLDCAFRLSCKVLFMVLLCMSFPHYGVQFWIRVFAFYLPILIMTVAQFQQLVLISYLTYCLKVVDFTDIKRLDRSLELYRLFIEVAKLANDRFGGQKLVVLCTMYGLISVDTYMFVTSIGKDQSLPAMVWSTAERPFFRIYEIWRTVYVNSAFTTQVNNDYKKLLEMVLFDRSDQLSTNKKLSVHLTMKENVTFSACGVVNLDMELIHSILASIISYIAMMLQFGGDYSRF